MLEIRRSSAGIEVHVAGIGSFPLPEPAHLKAAALETATRYSGEDSDVVALVRDCDFDYEIVPGKDSIEQLVALVVTTSSTNAANLRDDQHPIQSEFWAAIMEACPDIGDGRIIERAGT